MRMTDLIEKKRDGGVLSPEEIRWMIRGYTDGTVPDYQMSAMCMAICFRDMTDAETYELTMAMLESGGQVDLSGVEGVRADKHSTGGVGDKTSLVLCPMLAACGVKLAKLSGRGLGHTGGTLDKLESFPGFSTAMSMDTFIRCVNENGFAIAGQTAELVPADKKLYALRDVTGTVPSRPLIVSSIMSKKLAAGADIIVLDVKTGSGAFMRTQDEAFALARSLVDVGVRAGRRAVAVVTGMDEPLGHAVGNALEVREALAALRGEYAGGLLEVCVALGAPVLLEGGLAQSDDEARAMLADAIESGRAYDRFRRFIRAQGGEFDPSLLPVAPVQKGVESHRGGYVAGIDAHDLGLVCMRLGGGRAKKDDAIDHAVGVVLEKKVGDRVETGQTLAVIHARTDEDAAGAEQALRACFAITDERPEVLPLVRGVVR